MRSDSSAGDLAVTLQNLQESSRSRGALTSEGTFTACHAGVGRNTRIYSGKSAGALWTSSDLVVRLGAFDARTSALASVVGAVLFLFV